MNILLASSEVTPFAKTGGLADVCGALPMQLTALGHDVTVFLPAYRQTRHCGLTLEPTDIWFDIPIGSKIVRGRLLCSRLPDEKTTVYLVEEDAYFDRPELYRERGEDYKDNCERFIFFCRAVLESIRLLNLNVDLVHCNDWQTGLIPAYLNIEYAEAKGYEHIASLITIHNLAYQGNFWHWDMALTGLDWRYFNYHQMEFYGGLNLLKTGLVFSDAINTVSPRYAQEIQEHPLGCGLEGLLQSRRDVLSGIINGVDYMVWSPSVDDHLPAKYDEHTWPEHKPTCKAALQRELGLPESPETPLIGLIGRLADQKGFDLVAAVMQQWAATEEVQWAILGTGEPGYHDLLTRLAGEFKHRVAVRIGFSDALAHRIEAGSDIFLMPSRYEPCGLNQLYSLKYGTIPVVHNTGGLADTIVDASADNLHAGQANGFAFYYYSVQELESKLRRACEMFRHDRTQWSQLINTAMRQDWSWSNSARQYTELYRRTIQLKLESLPSTCVIPPR
ncbi:MAG TPA: glycogen synthase GlgA [Pirellulaceae bacterium]|nr:glycogen synthase GlgA [Pirellulaceae bacterium]